MSTEMHSTGTRRVGILGPLILIFLGFIFLTNTLGYLGWGIWGSMWKLWPLLLVLVGLDLLTGRRWLHITVPEMEPQPRSGRVVAAIVLILLGVVFLMGNLGVVGWGIWSALWRLWPIILISIGLDHLLGRTLPYGRYIALTLVALLVAGSLWSVGTAAPPGEAVVGQRISQPLQGATSADVDLSPSIGTLRITGGAAADTLIEGSVDRSGGERIFQSASASGGTLRYTLQSQDMPNFFIPHRDLTWDLRLSDQVPMRLNIHTGVGQSTLDLSSLKLTTLEVSTGIGQSLLTLPAHGHLQAVIHGGIGETTVRLPRGLAVSLHLQTGIGDIQVPAGYERRGDNYVSPNYDSAADRADIDISGGIGQIRVVDTAF